MSDSFGTGRVSRCSHLYVTFNLVSYTSYKRVCFIFMHNPLMSRYARLTGRSRLLTIFTVLALFAAACGGGDSGTAEPEPVVTSVPTVTEAPEPEPTMDMDAVEPTEQVEISELEPTEQATNVEPTSEMMLEATPEPTSAPTEAPIPNPTPEPTSVPTEPPTPVLTPEPTPVPTEPPTPVPTEPPTPVPTEPPTPVPTEPPTPVPTEPPTPVPTPEPTLEPIPEPTEEAHVPMPSEGYTQVAAFNLMACGLRVDQAIDCWGWGMTPDFVPSEGIFTGLKRVSQGVCGVRVDGSIACFGVAEFLSESGLYE